MHLLINWGYWKFLSCLQLQCPLALLTGLAHQPGLSQSVKQPRAAFHHSITERRLCDLDGGTLEVTVAKSLMHQSLDYSLWINGSQNCCRHENDLENLLNTQLVFSYSQRFWFGRNGVWTLEILQPWSVDDTLKNAAFHAPGFLVLRWTYRLTSSMGLTTWPLG